MSINTEVAQLLLKKYGKKNPPQVKSGDTVRVHQRIKEGDKERVQIFEGLVIATKHGSGLDGSFTVRKIATGGVGVERVYPVHSPNVIKVERVKTAKVSRTKLYYMRDLRGKAARFKVETRTPMTWAEPTAEELAALAEQDAPQEEPAAEEVITEDGGSDAAAEPVANATETEAGAEEAGAEAPKAETATTEEAAAADEAGDSAEEGDVVDAEKDDKKKAA